MGISREDIKTVATLSRLGLRETDIGRIETELEGILGYVGRLRDVDTKGVPESAPPHIEASEFRVDDARDCPSEDRELILKNFPARQGDLLKVPAVFERPKT
jgi:aspartyl-tRNA(Asn)/glutamyl-tRNA(Gln) amidotransferase subunit C